MGNEIQEKENVTITKCTLSFYKRIFYLTWEAVPFRVQCASNNIQNTHGIFLLLHLVKPVMQPLLDLLQNHIGNIIMSPIVEHNKVSVSRYVFHSKCYKRANKTDCTTAILPSGACVIIAHIVGFKDIFGRDRAFAVGEKFAKRETEVPHIYKSRSVQSSYVFEVKAGIVPCAYMVFDHDVFFAPLAFKAIFKNR